MYAIRSYYESVKMIKEDSSLFMFTKQDEFAQGQEILHLFGQTPEILIQNLAKIV